MERLRNRNILRATACALALGFTSVGCADDEPAQMHPGIATEADVRNIGQVTAIKPGESRFTTVVESDAPGVPELLEDLEETDFQYPVGWQDEEAPTIGSKPVRVDAHVALSGSKSNNIDNDIACDTINIDPSSLKDGSYIAAIAISDGKDPVQVNWPLASRILRSLPGAQVSSSYA